MVAAPPVTMYQEIGRGSGAAASPRASARPKFDEAFRLFDRGEADEARAGLNDTANYCPTTRSPRCASTDSDAMDRGENTPWAGGGVGGVGANDPAAI